MKIHRKGNILGIDSSGNVDNISQYLYRLINIYTGCFVKRSCWLTDKERLFLISLVINVNKGITDFKAKSSDEVFDKVFGSIVRSRRKDYVRRLEKKKWIKLLGNDVELLPVFYDIDETSDSFEIRMRVNINENGDR